MASRVTQQIVETLSRVTVGTTRVTQHTVEVLISTTAPAPGPVTGTLAVTQAAQTLAATGTVYAPQPQPLPSHLGRHYHDQIMLGLFHAEVPYDTPAASWPQAAAACSMSDFDDDSPHETWDDLVEDDDGLQHQDEYPTVQEIVRQSVRFTYTEPRVKPNTLAGLLALALGGTPVSVKDAVGNAWRHSMVPVHPFQMLSMSAQIAHQYASHWQYTGLKATNFTLKTNGPYLSLSCELLGSGKRQPVTSAWAPVVPEAWMPWGACRLWLRDVSIAPLALPTEPQQGSTNLGAGAIDISTRVLRMEVTHPNMLWGEGGYRPSTRVYRGMLHPGQRSTSLLLELEVDTDREATELGYYLTQARLAFEWQYVGEVIVPGGTYRYGATIILPCLQLQRLTREEQGQSDTLVMSGQVLSDRVNPPVQAWAYTAQPIYLGRGECGVVPEGLIACWDMNEDAGNRLAHVGGPVNTLVPHNAPLGVPGYEGKAVSLVPASQQYLYNSTDGPLPMSGAFTIIFRVRPMTTPVATAGLLTNGFSTQAGQYDFVVLALTGSSAVLVSFQAGNGGVITGDTLLVGQWNMVKIWRTITPEPNVLFLQVNANAILTTTYSPASAVTMSRFNVGATGGVGGTAQDYFDGDIDSVSFWNRALTAAERALF